MWENETMEIVVCIMRLPNGDCCFKRIHEPNLWINGDYEEGKEYMLRIEPLQEPEGEKG